MPDHSPTPTMAFSSAGIIWIKLSVIYLLVGIALGIMMGATEDFTLHPLHAHLNLLGWTTLALAGLIYSIFPQASQSRLAKIHFWLLNISLPVMMVALGCVLKGYLGAIPVLAISEIIGALGIVAFAANIFLNLKRLEA